jgi:protein-disulfide isomerase
LLAQEGYAALNLAELAPLGAAQVTEDLRLAGQFGVRSTPFSYLNGQAIDGVRSGAELEQLLSDEQRTATWLAASGLPATELYATRTSRNLIGVGDAAETRRCVPVGSSPTRGPDDALVTLVEFSDFECTYCKRVEPTLKTLLTRYPRALRIVWKNYPLAQHANARLLANFAFEAEKLGSSAAFWGVHDSLFAAEEALDEDALTQLGSKFGFDGALALAAARSGKHDKRITAETRLAEKVGVGGTPTFFVNGRLVQGALPLDQFDALVRAELGTAQRIVARGVPASEVYGLVCD